MRRIFHCAVAALCAAGACAYLYLSFSQSFFNIAFFATCCCLTYWQIERYRECPSSSRKAQRSIQQPVQPAITGYKQSHREEMIRTQKEIAEFIHMQEKVNRFYRENAQLLSRLQREYRSYIAEEYANQENMPEALSMATDRMMLKYGEGIYPAFRDRTAILCLSPSMYVANLDAAIKFVSTFRTR